MQPVFNHANTCSRRHFLTASNSNSLAPPPATAATINISSTPTDKCRSPCRFFRFRGLGVSSFESEPSCCRRKRPELPRRRPPPPAFLPAASFNVPKRSSFDSIHRRHGRLLHSLPLKMRPSYPRTPPKLGLHMVHLHSKGGPMRGCATAPARASRLESETLIIDRAHQLEAIGCVHCVARLSPCLPA